MRIQSSASPEGGKTQRIVPFLTTRVARSSAEYGFALLSAILLILAFPSFEIWPLAWCALTPLMLAIMITRGRWRPFFLGWIFGTVFFYGSCHWLTYSMIHTAGLSGWIAYPLLLPGAVLLGLFPALFGLFASRTIKKFGPMALLAIPFAWTALEWLRLEITGQLWNAIGYSQAFHPGLIGPARWGGVYAVGFLIVAINGALALLVTQRTRRTFIACGATLLIVVLVIFASSERPNAEKISAADADVVAIGIQPNVPMSLTKSQAELDDLMSRHVALSEAALKQLPANTKTRLVIWPESPMNFEYGGDEKLRKLLSDFAQRNRAALLLNSQELAPNDGIYNSALLINEQGKLVAQYDKIRLLPFGEYVPLPEWVPGSGLIRGLVGDFTAGTNYQLMPVGNLRAGVFICIESAYPSIARRFTVEGADVLINISNDGYLGPTAVMRQHLANAVFRAVENNRPLLSVTNTGITALITERGEVRDATSGFQVDTRNWTLAKVARPTTFFTRHGDAFVIACVLLSLAVLGSTFFGRKVSF